MFFKIFKIGDVFRAVGYKNSGFSGKSSKGFFSEDEILIAQAHKYHDDGIYYLGKELIELNDYERETCNISRAKSRVRELALCNSWEHFATITVASENQDRSDLKLLKKRFNQSIKDMNKKYSCRIKYLVVPELHSDGENWHLHGLFMGFPECAIEPSPANPKYNHIPYLAKRFGFTSISSIKDNIKCASYVTKYISKNFENTKLKKGEHMFFASVGLQGKELVTAGEIKELKGAYENDYVYILENKSFDKLLESVIM